MQISEFKLSKVLVALGGNLTSEVGPPLTTLKFALATIRMRTARLLNASRFFITPCFPAGMGPDYINAVVMFDFGGNPEDLLKLLHEIEALFGRRRDSRWGGRVLDLDLLSVQLSMCNSENRLSGRLSHISRTKSTVWSSQH